MTNRPSPSSIVLATIVALIDMHHSSVLGFSARRRHHKTPFQKKYYEPNYSSSDASWTSSCSQHCRRTTILALEEYSDDGGSRNNIMPLCDLQTFLRMCNLVDSGGEAKIVIQNSECMLNGSIEIRRSKKLYHGDKVSFGNSIDLDVSKLVVEKGYILKPKIKKTKPLPKVDSEGNLEFGGRYRSEEWRVERKTKKKDRKTKNRESK